MCNDKFVNVNVLSLNIPGIDRSIRLAYFPMMDHNPGPVPLIFKFTVDAVLYLADDPENTIAVHSIMKFSNKIKNHRLRTVSQFKEKFSKISQVY